MRLDRFLADMNLGTRKELKRAIRDGRVLVGGVCEKDAGRNVTESDEVVLDGARVSYHVHEYWMMNKPAGVLTATMDRKQKTVLDLLPEDRRKDLFPVGRLDRDTTGLLLLTNDGQLAHRLLAPKSHVDKVYRVLVRGILTGEDQKAFASGIRIGEDLVCLPAELVILRTDAAAETTQALVTIREGKFHQIKKMMAACGKEVLALKRLSMGPLALDPALAEGETRPLTEEETAALLKASQNTAAEERQLS